MIYVHENTRIRSKDLKVPQQSDFWHNQSHAPNDAAFDGCKLRGRHVLPLGVCKKVERELLARDLTRVVADVARPVDLRRLRNDLDERLAIRMPGNPGTVDSSVGTAPFGKVYLAAPGEVEALLFGRRGCGLSAGWPPQSRILQDALAIVPWVEDVAKLSPEKIMR